MAIVKGVVEAKSEKYGKYSVLINGNWYGTNPDWLTVKPVKGDTIEFDSGPDGKKYLSKVKILSSGPAPSGGSTSSGDSKMMPKNMGCFPVDPLHPDRSIIRQNAITNARELISKYGPESMTPLEALDEVLTYAKAIEAYTSGDEDAEEDKAAMEAMGMPT